MVSLGAVRLKIIDLAGGAQPIVSDDGDAVIVFNGEIYNHAELRAELEGLGHKFRSKCDTEVVLRGFLEWDTDCFARLRGMFAVALWRESRKRLVLARDRMGIKPLYLHRRGRDIYFGSELKAIFAHPEVDRRLSLEGLSHYLGLNYIPHPYTLIDGIVKLKPGSWLEWVNGEIREERYWRLNFAPSAKWTLGSAKEALDGLMRDSVKEHMLSDVPLGIWSSGGLDSSAILHYAAEAAGRKLMTFSVSFKGRSFDESRYFRLMAREYGTDHHEFDLNPERDLADTIGRMVWYSDEPSADAGALPVWYLSRMSRSHVTVALSGEGADEIFGGYYTYLADRYAARMRYIPEGIRNFGLRLAQLLPVSDDKISFEYKVKRFLDGSLLTADQAHLFWNGTFRPEQKRILLEGAPDTPLALMPGEAAGVNRYLWMDQLNYLPDDILNKSDRMSMAHSLEVRPPFLDHRIVEFAATLPEGLKIRGSKLKYALRELMRGKLPASVIGRSKQGFDIPTHHWFRESLRTLLRDTVTREAVESTGVMSWPVVEKVLHDHHERRANYGYHLWGLLMLFLWMKRWNVQAPAGSAARS